MILRRDRGMLAVLIILDVAFHAGRTSTVSAGRHRRTPPAWLAAASSRCCRTSLARACWRASAVRAAGYRLGRPRRDIHLDEVVRTALCEDHPAEDGPKGDLLEKVVLPLWGDLDRDLASRLRGLSLEDLVRRAEGAGLARPLSEPITFSI